MFRVSGWLGEGGHWRKLAGLRQNKRRKDVLDPASKSKSRGQGPAGLPLGGQAAFDVPSENLSKGESAKEAVWGVSDWGLGHSVLVPGGPVQGF